MDPKRILIFELNWLGDILFSYPFLRAVRKAFPEAYITCVVVPRYVDLLINNPWINDVHALSDDNSIFSLREKLEFISMIKREKYDTCFFLKPSRTKTFMAAYAGITERIGFEGKNAPLTRMVDKPSGELHRADQILSLAGAVDVVRADGTYEYFLNEVDEEKADQILHGSGSSGRRIVVLNAGGNWDAKRWPLKKFIELGIRLLERFKDIEVMISGAKKDIELTDEIVQGIDGKRCYSIAGKTGLNELAALFKRSVLVISADSGPLHLAAAVGTVTIGLFGPTSHDITGPRGRNSCVVVRKDVDCVIPCYVNDCEKDYICMRSISVDEVFKAAEKLLEESA